MYERSVARHPVAGAGTGGFDARRWIAGLTCAALIVLGSRGEAAITATPGDPQVAGDRCDLDACQEGCSCPFSLWEGERRLKSGYGMTADPEAAAYWYRRAAEAGDPQAAYNWGLILKQGRGVARDLDAARRWFERAADRGMLEALYVLGNLYRTGTGVAKDALAAVDFYRRAAERGHARSQHALGNMHGNGFGRGQDLVVACKWWRIAADKGHHLAALSLLRAEGMMTWPQVQRSRKLAEQWQAQRRGN